MHSSTATRNGATLEEARGKRGKQAGGVDQEVVSANAPLRSFAQGETTSASADRCSAVPRTRLVRALLRPLRGQRLLVPSPPSSLEAVRAEATIDHRRPLHGPGEQTRRAPGASLHRGRTRVGVAEDLQLQEEAQP